MNQSKIIPSYDGSDGNNEIAQTEFWRELEILENFMHDRTASERKIHRGPALRAIFRILAEPRSWSMGGGFA